MIKIISKHLACPIIIAITCSLFIYYSILAVTPNYQKRVVADDKIILQANKFLNTCKMGHYWFSWLVIEADTFYYVDVRGYNPETKEAYSVKEKYLNPHYFNIIDIEKDDIETRKFIKGFDTGLVGYYPDIEYLKQYNTIYKELTGEHLNIELKQAGISITRNSKKELIFFFLITYSGDKLTTCSRQDIAGFLGSISIYAKKDL